MFLQNLVDYIAAQVSLTLDTDLFLGMFIVDAPERSVCVLEISPGFESESGMMVHPIQVLSRDEDYTGSRSLLYSVHEVLRNKAGFSGLGDVKYCQVLNSPRFISKLDDGTFVFGSDYLVKRIYSE